MNKKSIFAIMLAGAMLTGCGSPAVSQRASELSAQYNYYEKSVAALERTMDISPDDADNVFLTMVDCGISSEINIVTKNTDGTFAVWSSGDNYTVTLTDNAVSSVFLNKDQLYPEAIKHNYLMDYELTVKDVMNGAGDTVLGQYAYIRVTDGELGEITPEMLKDFADSVVAGSDYNWVSIMTTSGNGICFAGSDITNAMQGKVDKDGSILDADGFWTRDSDGNYSYSVE